MKKAHVISHSMPMGNGLHGNKSGMSKKAAGYIAHKISKLQHEGRPEKQSIAIAMSMARQKGYKLPHKKK